MQFLRKRFLYGSLQLFLLYTQEVVFKKFSVKKHLFYMQNLFTFEKKNVSVWQNYF